MQEILVYFKEDLGLRGVDRISCEWDYVRLWVGWVFDGIGWGRESREKLAEGRK
jgi:hypothetical protein